MVGAVSVVGSSFIDSKTCPCLCFDALPSCKLTVGIAHACVLMLCLLANGRWAFSIAGAYDWHKARALFGGQILDYFTYKAVRVFLNQLYEMNYPARSIGKSLKSILSLSS
ncbi:chaperonin-like RbcX protein [Striga asiatica]|uniref:Chaperonin-like RbcX protein n=1 Tax=Striga asiatica TaxID=4170 RepID=A0A5A7NWZ9_STRAF|nr:chaperonin-like RbcX protein [Striga asiatica]